MCTLTYTSHHLLLQYCTPVVDPTTEAEWAAWLGYCTTSQCRQNGIRVCGSALQHGTVPLIACMALPRVTT